MSIFVETTKNSKIVGTKGNVCATYTSIKHTCPVTCKLKGEGCYAQLGNTGLHSKRFEKSIPDHFTPDDLAKLEAQAIDASFYSGKIPQDSIRGGRELRLHVSGDTTTKEGAKLISAAVKRWYKRGGGKVWTYTHAWSMVSRKSWKGVSILASLDSTKDLGKALKQGYGVAIVVPEHKSSKAFELDGYKYIPCPQQTVGTPCVQCRLCFDADGLKKRNTGIAFAAHGVKTNNIKRRLAMV
jgi:hypothetical protein